jgi:hypothetical protein
MQSRAEASQLGRRTAPKDARLALAILPKREFATIRAYPEFGREKYRGAVRVLSRVEAALQASNVRVGLSRKQTAPSDWNWTDRLNSRVSRMSLLGPTALAGRAIAARGAKLPPESWSGRRNS